MYIFLVYFCINLLTTQSIKCILYNYNVYLELINMKYEILHNFKNNLIEYTQRVNCEPQKSIWYTVYQCFSFKLFPLQIS